MGDLKRVSPNCRSVNRDGVAGPKFSGRMYLQVDLAPLNRRNRYIIALRSHRDAPRCNDGDPRGEHDDAGHCPDEDAPSLNACHLSSSPSGPGEPQDHLVSGQMTPVCGRDFFVQSE